MKITTRIACFGTIAAAALAIGCGGDDDGSNNADRFDGEEAAVAAVVDDLADAGRDGDGARVCEEVFTEQLARNVEREAQQSCQSEVMQELPEDEYELEVDSVEVKGRTATVSVTDQDDNRSVLRMVKSGEDWRIQGVTGAS